jgi:tetratricopeptide (TPR) repeat protein
MADRPTPSSIAICTLITLYVDPSSPLGDLGNGYQDELMNLLYSLVRTPIPQTISDILKKIDDVQVTTILQGALHDASSSIDGLIDLMMSIQSIIVDGSLGVYVRRVCLGFDHLSFENMTSLWEALQYQTECHENEKDVTYGAWNFSPLQKQELLMFQSLSLDDPIIAKSKFAMNPQTIMLLENETEIPAAHFLKFLNHLQGGIKNCALDALHQYFDYAMIAERKDMKRQVVLHYATLLLAAVYHDFGDMELAHKATEEALHVAQQSGDPACVAYALSFLYHATGKSDYLRQCASRALQAKLRPLVARANLALAKVVAPSPGAWNSLLQATTDHSSTSLDRPTHIDDISSSDEAMEVLGQTSFIGAGIWESMGHLKMSELTAEIALDCFGQSVSSSLRDVALQSLARKALVGPLWIETSISRYGIALLSILDQGTKIGTLLLLHEWAVRRGEYGHAKTIMHCICSQLHPRLPNFKELEYEVEAQNALSMARTNWIGEARTKLRNLLEKCRKEKKVVLEGRLLIQYAVMELDVNKSEFRSSVNSIRSCLKLALDNSMDVIHAIAISQMAKVNYRLGKLDTAVAMLVGVLPMLRQNADIWFVGEAYLTLSKCFLKRESIELASSHLKKSREFFLQCQDCVRLQEVYYLQSKVYHSLKNYAERDRSSQLFVEISEHLGKGTLPASLGDIGSISHLKLVAQRQVHSQ